MDMPLLQDDDAVQIIAAIERVIFHNAENGYTVLKVMPQGAKDGITVVGHTLEPQAGVQLKISGKWVNNARFGRQLHMESFDEVMPASTEGIRLYLGSGLLKGVGETTAARIVKAFGVDTIKILDEDPERLLTVKGIGKKSYKVIVQGWAEHRGVRELMIFLQPHGITANYAVRIYKHYGSEALSVVQENPYRMAMDIRGIGFISADNAAQKLGFTKEHPLRAEAGLLYTLTKCNDDGHVFMPQEKLVAMTSESLEIPYDLVEAAIASVQEQERIVCEEMQGEMGVFLARYYHYESKIAYYLKRILMSPKSVRFENTAALVQDVIDKLSITLAEEQEEAVHMASQSKIMVLTGGPGTGKTTIIKAIIQLFSSVKAKILLAAPTGRAAKRMAEATEKEAKTIHRLLEYNPGEDGFARNEDNPLACSLLIVDEASMMDTMLFYHLLKAAPMGATIVLVGDVHQLPSVGPGNVLKDIIASKALPVVELTEIFRQSAQSEIIRNAHLINHGEVPCLESNKETLTDFYFIRQNNPEQAAAMVADLVKNHIPRRFGLNAIEDIQVLTPMHKGAVGSENLNGILQSTLMTHKGEKIQRGEKTFYLHDKVMQIRNNYDKDVFNGDIGRIIVLDAEKRQLTVRFDERNVLYEFEELDEIVSAYAISIHKSQGSEYPAVVIPLMMQHYMLLQRNLVYTGITRGKKLVVLVGESKALHMAIKNNRTHKRYTRLCERLMPEE